MPVSVHGVCGAFGTIAVGLFSTFDAEESGGLLKEGLFYGGGVDLHEHGSPGYTSDALIG